MNKRNLLLLGFFLNFILCFLPVYDSSNIIGWVGLGLSFQRTQAVFSTSLNPADFFLIMILIPMELVYEYTLDIYLSALILKLILFTFFAMFVLIMNKIFEYHQIDIKSSNFLITLILFNPGIMFIDLIWVELEIIPIFFVTLSYYLLRVIPFKSVFKSYLFSSISLMVSIFFFLYPIIFLPSFVLFTKGKKAKITIVGLYTLLGGLLLAIQIILMQGRIYDYIGSLSGTSKVLAPSSLSTGLFYYLNLMGSEKIITDLSAIFIVSIIGPIILFLLGYEEQKVLYVISALFIFISPVINMDNFLFVIPFVFLSAINNYSNLISKKKALLISSILLIPIAYAPFVYSFNNVFGVFYWFYPLFHINGPVISSSWVSNVILPAYNLSFLLAISITISFVLLRKEANIKFGNVNVQGKSDLLLHRNIYYSNKHQKLIVIILLLVMVSAPISFIYNENNNAVSISNPHNFPLLYFTPESKANPLFLPIGKNSYSLTNGNLSIPQSTTDMLLERELHNQYFFMNTTLTISNYSSLYNRFAFTNKWSIQECSILNKSLLSEYKSSNFNSGGNSSIILPFVNAETKIYNLNNQTLMCSTISTNSVKNKTFAWFFNQTNVPHPQSDPFQIKFGDNVLEIAVDPTYAVIALWKPSTGWKSTPPISTSPFYLHGWSFVKFNVTRGKINLSLDGVSYSTNLSKNVGNITVMMGNPYKNYNNFRGNATQLYCYKDSISPFFYSGIICFEGVPHLIEPNQNNPIVLNITFSNTPTRSTLRVNKVNYVGGPSSVIEIGKVGTALLTMKINKLTIKYSNLKDYYLVPAFLAFYLPFVFAGSLTYFVTKKEQIIPTD